MPNCSQATCEGNNVVSLSPRQCPEMKAPSCANGYPPLKVDDQDGCCQHYQCQCEWGHGSKGGRMTEEERMRTPGKTFRYQVGDGTAKWRELSPRAVEPSGRRGGFSVSQNPSSL